VKDALREIKVEERLTRIEQLIETAMLMLLEKKKEPEEPLVAEQTNHFDI
jgi:hypothetical protein